MINNGFHTTASSFQKDKNAIALLRRDDLDWNELFPLSIRQTQFPAFFEQQHSTENDIH